MQIWPVCLVADTFSVVTLPFTLTWVRPGAHCIAAIDWDEYRKRLARVITAGFNITMCSSFRLIVMRQV
jgi:hypothetical protein